MKLWIDTEFNSFRGELISMALVDEDDRRWYRSLGCVQPHPWVAANVMPVLDIEPVSYEIMQRSLQSFLSVYSHIHIIADWPEDVEHFCRLLITGPGTRLDTPPLTLEVRRDLDCTSEIPHNALADARANKAAYVAITQGAPRK